MSTYFLIGEPSPEAVALIESGAVVPDEMKRDVHLIILEAMARYATSLKRLRSSVRSKPLMGDVWGHGQYVLASQLSVTNSLYEVHYLVLECSTWLPVGTGHSKAEALSSARALLKTVDAMLLGRFIALLAVRQKVEADQAEKDMQERMVALQDRQRESASSKPKIIGRRRQKIFAESDGKCHYCATALTLDGRWHIEHKMPKALGGGNEPGNLVASCAPCNHKKRDRTDVEFIASRAVA